MHYILSIQTMGEENAPNIENLHSVTLKMARRPMNTIQSSIGAKHKQYRVHLSFDQTHVSPEGEMWQICHAYRILGFMGSIGPQFRVRRGILGPVKCR